MTSPGHIVELFRHKLSAGDFGSARALLHDDLSFRGPIDTFTAPEPYLESLKKLGQIVERIDVKKTFVDGDDVCVLYDMVTKTAAGTAFIAEWYRVRDEQIASIRVVFDPRPFAAMFGQQSPARPPDADLAPAGRER
jgi:hypothetical protein